MKPYLYILAVLLVGGMIGYFVGQKSTVYEQNLERYPKSGQEEAQSIYQVLDKQKEAYRLHDALLLLQDCSSSYIEINGNTGESYTLERSLIFYHQLFKTGKSVEFNLQNPEIKITKNMALIKASYSKTSDSNDREGIRGLVGEGLWILSKASGRWQIHSFCWVEDVKG
jgi:hypothetical protein